jgi:hypothetical protein
MHCGPPDVHWSCRRYLLTALGQGGVRVLVMELADDRQILSDLPRIPAAMRLGFNTARLPVTLEEVLDKAQTHPYEL